LVGVVVKSRRSRELLAAELNIPVFQGVDDILLEDVDAVDIVTPVETHFDLVSRFLPQTNVLVEKPLAATVAEAAILAELAERSTNTLAVGHTYRFHQTVGVLQKLVAEAGEMPKTIFGILLNPAAEAPPDPDPSMEMLHHFDIIDLLFGAVPDRSFSVRQGDAAIVSLRYPNASNTGFFNAVLRLGWEGARKQRALELVFRDRSLQADLMDQTITVEQAGSMRRIILPQDHSSLEADLRSFVAAVRQRTDPNVSAAIGARIVGIAHRSRPKKLGGKPRVAVIGGGIFGATCAAELASFCEVMLIERHSELLGEASTLNQWRYHHGFHYPRSTETIREIQECRHEFESVYGRAIIDGFPSYYATARSARVITADRYLQICKSMGLGFVAEPPPSRILDPEQINLCLRTGEGVFNAASLRSIVDNRLRQTQEIEVALEHEVIGGELLADGRKRLTIFGNGRDRHEDFDYVVNATYANRNLLAGFFGFPRKPLRFDLLELLILEIPLPKMSVTVLDGPFTSLVSMGEENLFTLSHIQHSVLASETPLDGLPPIWAEKPSNRANMIRHASQYLPILRDARYVGSRYGTRTVHALPEDADGRPTVVVEHGFGCWSVLGGKVNTSVSNARQIASQIAAQQQLEHRSAAATIGGMADDGEEWRERSPTGARRR
jgi:predicted dehydrogenase